MSAGDDPVEIDIRVQLARMEGKQDVTNERLNNVQNDITDIRRVQHGHAEDIMLLKTDRSLREGKTLGVTFTSRLVWGAISFLLGSGGVFAVFELVK